MRRDNSHWGQRSYGGHASSPFLNEYNNIIIIIMRTREFFCHVARARITFTRINTYADILYTLQERKERIIMMMYSSEVETL